MKHRLSSGFAAVTLSAMGKHAKKYAALLLSVCMLFGIAGAQETVPFDTVAPIDQVDFSFVCADGTTVSKDSLAGSPYLLFFGRTYCGNTRALLADLEYYAGMIGDIPMILGLYDLRSDDELVSFQEEHPLVICVDMGEGSWYDCMWSQLRACGNSGSVTFPAVFWHDGSGGVIYWSTGYVSEPERLIALMLSTGGTASGGTLILPGSLTSVEEEAFMNDTGIRTVIIPGSVTHIGARAFKDCVNLEKAVIPAGVTVAEDAFSGCTKLTIVRDD